MTRTLSILAALLILGGGACLAAEETLRIVPGRGIGPMLLNGTPGDVARSWGSARERPAEREGTEYRWHEYPERGAWMLSRSGRIVKCGVEDDSAATGEGFGVGTRARDVVRAWGEGELERAIPWHELPEARQVDKDYKPDKPPERFYLKYPARGISFLVDTSTDSIMSIFVYPPGRRGGS